MGRFLRITVKRLAPCWYLDGHVKELYEMSMALGPRPQIQLPLQSACTYMCRNTFNLMIVACGVKQSIPPVPHSLDSLAVYKLSTLVTAMNHLESKWKVDHILRI